jgi:Restriction endonuclease
MATVAQVQGMLLEEVLLHLLRSCGYEPVINVGNDPTLSRGRSGLEVRGRGENHQIDAIADFRIPQPFTNPSRLLVEAKFKNSPAGIEVVRNAVGVLKDVSEYWATSQRPSHHPRYHYQYAILSASGFTEPAQQYAAAQDVFLIPFARGGFFTPVLDAISAVSEGLEGVGRGRQLQPRMRLSELRRVMRRSLMDGIDLGGENNLDPNLLESFQAVINAGREIEYTVLAVALNRLSIVLTPAPGVRLRELDEVVRVRIYWNETGWYLEEANDHRRRLFSFDLPEVLFKRYADQNRLTPERAVQLKGEVLTQIDALVVQDGRVRLIRFELDREWIQRVRERIQ